MNSGFRQFNLQAKLNAAAAKLAGIILAPRRAISRILEDDEFLTPLVILIVFLAILRIIMLPELLQQYETQEFRDWYQQTRKVGEAEMNKDIELMKKSAPVMAVTEAALTVLAGTVSIALLLYLIGRVAYKQKVPFRLIFSMCAWTSIISVIPLIVNIPLKLINHDWFLPTNLSVLLTPELVGGYLSRVLSVIDIFLIWQAWLLSIGMSVMFNVTIQRAVSSVGTMFVVFAVFNAVALGRM
ncbi:YIP1 family protein [bacterium]|nr:YIP1 family protein [bacterium]